MKIPIKNLRRYLIFLLGFCLQNLQSMDVIVRTDHGKIEGYSQTISGSNVYTFLGVPFAKPPVGSLRFADPQEMDDWDGVKMTKTCPQACYQVSPKPEQFTRDFTRMWLPTKGISEDCLYLNIWTQKVKEYPPINNFANRQRNLDKMPVMVWIHGGGFVSGSISPEVLNGAYLARMKNVVVVTIQYRLGLFGQMKIDNSDTGGNQALKDQILAIKWIKNNVEQFGGNKEMITLFGNDAGAYSIAVLSQLTIVKDLFQQAILQSPTFNVKVLTPEQLLPNLIEKLGCRIYNKKIKTSYIECLKSISPELLTFDDKSVMDLIGMTRQHVPNTSSLYKYKAGNRFVKYFAPSRQTGEPKINHRLIVGFVKDEGSMDMYQRLPEIFSNDQGDPSWTKVNLTNNHFYHLLKSFIVPDVFTRDISLRYFALEYGLTDANQYEIFQKLNQLIGDIEVKCNTFGIGNMGKIYSHIYSWNKVATNKGIPEFLGVPRGSEVEFFFGMPFNPEFTKNFYNYTDKERELSRRAMKFISNFSYTGSPNNGPTDMGGTPFWKTKISESDPLKYLQITEDYLKMKLQDSVGRCKLIRETFSSLIIHLQKTCQTLERKTFRGSSLDMRPLTAPSPKLGYQHLLVILLNAFILLR